jgi:hypothetical protein
MWMMKLVWLLTALWGRREALVYCGSEDTKGASIAAKRKGADLVKKSQAFFGTVNRILWAIP